MRSVLKLIRWGVFPGLCISLKLRVLAVHLAALSYVEAGLPIEGVKALHVLIGKLRHLCRRASGFLGINYASVYT